MRTVKQVSDITGVSVRMLHHYDKIGLLKPKELTNAGYRLYDDESLENLQQILFFKELDFSLNEIKEIITTPNFDKTKALENHKKLIALKRDRLNGLLKLIDESLEGAKNMSFKEFDMSEYYEALSEFKRENTEKVIKLWGSLENFDKMINSIKSKEEDFYKMAVEQYGSINKYTDSVLKNINESLAIKNAEKIDKYKEDILKGNNKRLQDLYLELTKNLKEIPNSDKVQAIANKIKELSKEEYEVFKGEFGEDYWYSLVQAFRVSKEWLKEVNYVFKNGASEFIFKALNYNLGNYETKLESLYKKLTFDLNKDIKSKEIRKIVSLIVKETEFRNKRLNISLGENYWSYIGNQYLSNSILREGIDKKYGKGASDFIGKAIEFYFEN